MIISHIFKTPSWLTTKWVVTPDDELIHKHLKVTSVKNDYNSSISSLEMADLLPLMDMESRLEILVSDDGYIVSVWDDIDFVEAILPNFYEVTQFIKDNT